MTPESPDPAERADTAEFVFHPPGAEGVRVRIDVAARTHPGKVRESNEDSFVVLRMGRHVERLASNLPEADLPERSGDAAHVMIVADGVGGHEGGEVASRTALLATMRFILEAQKWSLRLDDPATRAAEVADVRAQAEAYLASVHHELRRVASTRAELAGMGTTLTCAYLAGTDLFVVHVGDSKAYLIRGARMRKITRDHTVAQEYADMGLIAQEDVATHRMQHVLTRAVGGPDAHLEGDIDHLRVAPGDRLLLCSDGLTDMASEDRIAAALAAHASSEDACRALVDLALEGGGRDNVTVIVAGLSPAE